MSYPVYSTSFIQESALSGTGEYAVPEGYKAVVRYIHAATGSGTGKQAWFQGSLGQNLVFIQSVADINDNAVDCRIVFEPLDIMKFVVTSGLWNVYVGGYLLTLP